LRGSALNFVGTILGMAISFFGYPFLVRGLGTERFGVSSIAGAVIGYFLMFDLGLGRASVVFLGKALEIRDEEKISRLFWSGQILMGALGLLGCLVMILTTPYLCRTFLHVPAHLMEESIWGLVMISLSVPVMIVFSAHLGFLGNLGRFGTTNLVRSAMNILTWVVPLIALNFRRDLPWIFGFMLLTRIVVVTGSLIACLQAEPALRTPRLASWEEIKPLLGQGGWMSVTNLVSPLMTYMDRTLLGAWASLTAVTYYSVAGDTTQKLWIVQSSIAGALFPLLPGLLQSSRERGMDACRAAWRLIFLAIVPSALLASAIGRPFLRHWIGVDIAAGSATPFSILLLGVFLNSFAYVPFCLLMAENRSRYAALLHLSELPLFLALLYILVPRFGATGASIAWTLRVAVDTVVLLVGGRAPFTGGRLPIRKDLAWIFGTTLVLFASCFPIQEDLRAGISLAWVGCWMLAYRSEVLSRIETAAARLFPNRFHPVVSEINPPSAESEASE
jgi:O-antigen/teichoic acid export membrane protein